MNSLFKILPVVAVLCALGGAIYYVTSQQPAPVASSPEEAAPVAKSNGAPMSDRYSTGG